MTTQPIRAFANANFPAENIRIAPVLEGTGEEVLAKALRITRNGRRHKKLLLVNSRNETITVLLGYVPAYQCVASFLA